MKKFLTIIIAILIIIIQIYLVSVQPINAQVTLIYDDALMISQANSILKGEWLGEYNCLTLIKGPITPIFMAISNLLHIPFLIAQDIFYILSCLLLIFVFRKIIKSNFARIITLIVLIFHPIIYSTELCRTYRDGIYLALIIYLIACTFGIFLNRKEKISKVIGYYIGLGFTIGAIYLCREEIVWLVPYLAISTLMTIIYIIKDKEVFQKKQKVLLYLASIAIIAIMILSVMILNYKYYGVFQLNQYWGKEFKEAYGALTRILPEEEIPKVPVTKDALEKAYEISPKFNALRNYFERYTFKWAVCGDGDSDQIQGGYFHWALIRAVEEKGYYKDAKTANEYYTQMAEEINKACDEKKVECLEHKRVSNVIRFDAGDIYKSILKSKDTIKYQYELNLLEVKCKPNSFTENFSYKAATNMFEDITLTEKTTGKSYDEEKDKFRIDILQKIRDTYAKVNPYLFYESIVGAAIFIVISIVRKQNNSEKIIVLIGLAGIYLCRIFIITFTAENMFTTAVNVMYLSVTYIVQILFAVLANIFLAGEIKNIIIKRVKVEK